MAITKTQNYVRLIMYCMSMFDFLCAYEGEKNKTTSSTSVRFYGFHFSSIHLDFFSLHEIKMHLHNIILRLCKLSFDCICNIEIQLLKNLFTFKDASKKIVF